MCNPGLPSRSRDRTGLAMLLDLFLVGFSLIFLFVPRVGLRWLLVRFLLHVKYTVSYHPATVGWSQALVNWEIVSGKASGVKSWVVSWVLSLSSLVLVHATNAEMVSLFYWLVPWLSGRTWVFDRRAFTVLHST